MSHDTLPHPVKTGAAPAARQDGRRRRHWTRRPDPLAGLGSVVWLVVVIVPVYAMITARSPRGTRPWATTS